MTSQPDPCRAIVFIDGQNLSKAAERAFGHKHPRFDPLRLGHFICRQHGWMPMQISFYSGIPPIDKNPFWHSFWSRRKTSMMRQGIVCKTRQVNYRAYTLELPDKTRHPTTIAEEKGIDVWIAVDLISLAYRNEYDVAVVFSQDQDLCPAIDEVKRIAKEQGRWIKLVSAYPVSNRSDNHMGIRGTDYIRIEENEYNQCLDPYDYVSRATDDAKNYHR
jgi:uncharacterized LabA/DUF88 family protein